MPAPHHSVFYRPDALPAAQQRQSTEGLKLNKSKQHKNHTLDLSKVYQCELFVGVLDWENQDTPHHLHTDDE